MTEKLLALTVDTGSTTAPVDFQNIGIPSGGLDQTITIIKWIIGLALFAAVLFCFYQIVYAGFVWLTSEGDEKKITAAKQTITYAIFGLVVCFLVFTIANLIGYVLGVHLFF